MKNQAYLQHQLILKMYRVTLKMSLILKYCYFSRCMRCHLKYIKYPFHYLFQCNLEVYLFNINLHFVFRLLVLVKAIFFYFFVFCLFQFLLDFWNYKVQNLGESPTLDHHTLHKIILILQLITLPNLIILHIQFLLIFLNHLQNRHNSFIN